MNWQYLSDHISVIFDINIQVGQISKFPEILLLIFNFESPLEPSCGKQGKLGASLGVPVSDLQRWVGDLFLK